MSANLVSVIVPTFKREESLLRALNSLGNQTYKNFEIIIVNDCIESVWVDKVTRIVEGCKASLNVVLIHNNGAHGSAAARDVGIGVAKGEYITFLDDDDYYLPQKIESQLSLMLATNSDFSTTDLEQYDENGNFLEKRDRAYIDDMQTDALFKYHYLYHLTCTNTLMFKTAYLRKIGGFNCVSMGDEFYLMEKAIEEGGKFCYDNHCYVQTVVHRREASVSTGKGKIAGEKQLYMHKKKNFSRFTKKEQKQIKVRYKMVIAYAYLRMKRYIACATYMFQAVVISLPKTIKYLKKR